RFDGNARDDLGRLDGKLHGGASIVGGSLRLNGRDAFVETEPLAKGVREKTLEAWVVLDNLDQAGGGVITIEALAGTPFDSIVFGERQPRRWTAASENFLRTKVLEAPEESASAYELIHMAIVYGQDNSIAMYRNGKPYGAPYLPAKPLQTFQAGQSH